MIAQSTKYAMKNDVDLHLLHMNYLEFLTMYLEGRLSLPLVLQMNERIYKRDHATLSPLLIKATTALYDIKERIDHGEAREQETIDDVINDIVLELLKTLSHKEIK
jgi:hypothetical protein